jgi:hypothetical protein
MQFNGKILHAGYAVADPVAGSIEEVSDAGIYTWHGDLIASPTAVIVPGQTYTLELSDGRTGEIMILKLLHHSQAVSAFRFSGLGALQEPSRLIERGRTRMAPPVHEREPVSTTP